MSIYEQAKSFLGNPLVATGLAVVFTWMGYRLGHRRSRPTIWMTSERQMTWGNSESVPTPFEIRYAGEVLDRVSKGAFVFWNAGNATLEGSEVSYNSPIRLSLPDGAFLDVKMVRCSNEAAGVRVNVSEDRKSISLNFEYFDPEEGVAIEFLHTSKLTHPTFEGRVKGNRVKVYSHKAVPRKNRSDAFFGFALVLASLMMLGLFAFREYAPENFQRLAAWPFMTAPEGAKWGGFGSGFLYLCIGLYFLWKGRRKYPKVLAFSIDSVREGDPSSDVREGHSDEASMHDGRIAFWRLAPKSRHGRRR